MAIKELKDFTNEEKLKHFDKLFLEALNYYKGVMGGDISDDGSSARAHAFFEAVIDLLGGTVWDDINSKF